MLIAATAIMLAGLPFGVDPLWRVEALTLSEAAALRDTAEVVRLIDRGEDPNRISRVRPDILGDNALELRPIEAAVAAERADMVELLLEHGVEVDAALWVRLMCYSARGGAEDVRALLEPRRPTTAVENCEQIQIPW